MKGKLADDFKKWLGEVGRKPRSNPPFKSDALIIPWLYDDGGLTVVTEFERAAVDAYRTAKRSSRVSGDACFYDSSKNAIVLPLHGVPGLFWWTVAYMDYVWENFLDDDVKRQWYKLLLKPSNFKGAQQYVALYVVHTRWYIGEEEATEDVIARAAFSMASSHAMLHDRPVFSLELIKFAEKHCEEFFVTEDRR
jgi:hypothetical protein